MKQRTNEEWLRALRGSGPEQQAALDDLRDYLLHVSLYFFSQRQNELGHLAPSEVDSLAQDIAQDAEIAILERLDDFRGESKFTTWAYSFAINLAMVETRRHRNKSLSLETLLDRSDAPELAVPDEKSPDPSRAAQQREVWRIVREVIDQELTERQRRVLLAVASEEVPMDALVREWKTNRNAIYKTMHDARVKLKQRLEERGFGVDEILKSFDLDT